MKNGEAMFSDRQILHLNNHDSPPRFFSLEFHAEFFPQVMKNRFRRNKMGSQTTAFSSTMEMMISLAGCVILAIIGIPPALTHGSIIGCILSIIGIGGIVLLIIISIGSQIGNRPVYDDFLTGVFLLFVCLGLFIGIPVGMNYHSLGLGLSASLAGLVAGYVLGIVAGLRLQHLGWLAMVVNMLAALGAIVLCGAALILLIVVVYQ